MDSAIERVLSPTDGILVLGDKTPSSSANVPLVVLVQAMSLWKEPFGIYPRAVIKQHNHELSRKSSHSSDLTLPYPKNSRDHRECRPQEIVRIFPCSSLPSRPILHSEQSETGNTPRNLSQPTLDLFSSLEELSLEHRISTDLLSDLLAEA